LVPKSSYRILTFCESIKFILISFIFSGGDIMQAEVSTLFGLNIYTEKQEYISEK